ncbi:LCP family protein [Blastococcus sp. Marseille-P5729]|uniref:LCP family protein n=1 Tax=Blastococcus sp. Marseille-P5729 TaxID=2086582 RepID=UPI000D0E4D13|nr:LCP family protein [Blastococcus sp. Marseille-P5729]
MKDEPVDERPLPPELDPRSGMGAAPRRRSAQKPAPWVKVVRGIAGVLSVLLLAGAAYGTSLMNRAHSGSGTLAGTEGEHNSDRLGNHEDINILVVGNDSRAGYTQEQLDQLSTTQEETLATDTIMLIHVPANGTRIRVVSFPRDSWVSIPDMGSKHKINAAYVNGYYSLPDDAAEEQRQAAGQAYLINTVSQLSGLKIDHYVEVTLLGFYDLTNALGGVEVNLCAPSKDPSGDSGADFPAGKQVLEGQEALSFVRQRKGLEGGDLGRIKRQQYFFGAVIRQVLDQGLLDLVNVGKLTNIIDALSGTIRYDQNLDPIALADQMSNIAAGNVEFMTIPLAENYEEKIDGMDVVIPADQAVLDKFFDTLSAEGTDDDAAGSSAPEAPATVDPKSVTLDVYNGTEVEGAQQTVADELSAQGFQIENTLTAYTTDYAASIVQYPAGMEKEANTVAAAVPGATVEESDQVDKVLLIVGQNYPGLLPEAPPQTETPAPEPTEPATAADEGCIN